jgi:hypothetical protein
LEIYINGKANADTDFIEEINRNLVHAFNSVSAYYLVEPNERVRNKITELFRENAILPESTEKEKMVYASQVISEYHNLIYARKTYREALQYYGRYQDSGGRSGYADTVDLTDTVMRIISKICMDNNLVQSTDGWSFSGIDEKRTDE